MDSERYDRNIRFVGKEGQNRLAAARVAVVGVGGLGTHAVQQLALLGVGHLALIDPEELDTTNFNRYVGVRHDDPVPGTLKVSVGERLAKEIKAEIQVSAIRDPLTSKDAFDAVIASDYVFGCLDNEGARLVLTELCAAYSKPYFDLASEIIPGDPPEYGGRLCVAWDGQGCLVCFDELDTAEAQADLMDPQQAKDRADIYGLSKDALHRTGPSVVSINGVVASLGVTEFMLAVTQVRPPRRLLRYRGSRGVVGEAIGKPAEGCYYCTAVRGKSEAADVKRYLRELEL
jgi:molybdopterin-synthase adenylyltransferase